MNGVPGAGWHTRQLPLGVTLRHPRSFSNFVAGPNAGAIAVLRDLLAGRVRGVVYLWGGSGWATKGWGGSPASPPPSAPSAERKTEEAKPKDDEKKDDAPDLWGNRKKGF